MTCFASIGERLAARLDAGAVRVRAAYRIVNTIQRQRRPRTSPRAADRRRPAAAAPASSRCRPETDWSDRTPNRPSPRLRSSPRRRWDRSRVRRPAQQHRDQRDDFFFHVLERAHRRQRTTDTSGIARRPRFGKSRPARRPPPSSCRDGRRAPTRRRRTGRRQSRLPPSTKPRGTATTAANGPTGCGSTA